jgi:hypothetical protein
MTRLREAAAGRWLWVGFLILAGLIYAGYVEHGGWYYDDWLFYGNAKVHPGGIFDDFGQCAETVTGGRQLVCAYHVTEYNLFGGHRGLYHVAMIGFLALDATLLAAIVRRARVGVVWAALAGAALILFPAADSTRLWAVAAIGQYVMALTLGSILLAQIATTRSWGRGTLALHAASVVLALIALLSYEVALPLLLLGGPAYLAATWPDWRRAVKRWAFDLAALLVFLFYRLVLHPVDDSTGFVVHRKLDAVIDRGLALEGDAWRTWHYVFAPGALGVLALLTIVAAGVACAVLRPERRRRLLGFGLLGVYGVVLSAVSALVFITANDLYRLQVGSTFNRLNLPGGFGYVLVAVALLGVVWEVARALPLKPWPGVVALLLLVAWGANHQLGISSSHKEAWEASWQDQERVIPGFRAALADVPANADVIGFDFPLWERDFVPVYSASWDLLGMLFYETHLRPASALPRFPDLACAADGVTTGGVTASTYDDSARPLYFVSPVRRQAVRIDDQKTCERILARWPANPFWGSTVTGTTS